MPEFPEPDCWLHPGVEVRASRIAGEGLFARVPIPAGTVVSRLGGRLVSWAELEGVLDEAARQPGRPYVDTVTVTQALHLVLSRCRANTGCPPCSN